MNTVAAGMAGSFDGKFRIPLMVEVACGELCAVSRLRFCNAPVLKVP